MSIEVELCSVVSCFCSALNVVLLVHESIKALKKASLGTEACILLKVIWLLHFHGFVALC